MSLSRTGEDRRKEGKKAGQLEGCRDGRRKNDKRRYITIFSQEEEKREKGYLNILQNRRGREKKTG